MIGFLLRYLVIGVVSYYQLFGICVLIVTGLTRGCFVVMVSVVAMVTGCYGNLLHRSIFCNMVEIF